MGVSSLRKEWPLCGFANMGATSVRVKERVPDKHTITLSNTHIVRFAQRAHLVALPLVRVQSLSLSISYFPLISSYFLLLPRSSTLTTTTSSLSSLSYFSTQARLCKPLLAFSHDSLNRVATVDHPFLSCDFLKGLHRHYCGYLDSGHDHVLCLCLYPCLCHDLYHCSLCHSYP